MSFELDPQRLLLEETILFITRKCYSINLLELPFVEAMEECRPPDIHLSMGINDEEMKKLTQFVANECFKRRHGQVWSELAELRESLKVCHPAIGFFDDAALDAIVGQVAALSQCRKADREKEFKGHLLDFTAHALYTVWLGSKTHEQYPDVTSDNIRALLDDLHVYHSTPAQKFLLKCIGEGLSSTACLAEFRKVLLYVRKPYTHAHMAAQFGDHDMVSLMLRTPDFVTEVSDYNGFTPLHYALDAGREDITLLLISYDADVHLADRKGMEPLHYAALRGLRAAANELLQRGASGYARSHAGETPLDLSLDNDFRSFLKKQMVEAVLQDKRETLMSTLERMAWIAILLATTTFNAFMQPPQGFTDAGLVRLDSLGLMTAFWVLDILAFSFSLFTVVLVVALSFPSPKRLSSAGVWLTLASTSFTLIMGMVCGLFAYVVGVLLVVHIKAVYLPLSLGVLLVLLAIVYYIVQGVHLYPGNREVRNALWRRKQQPQLGVGRSRLLLPESSHPEVKLKLAAAAV